jgi:hypothetical protein
MTLALFLATWNPAPRPPLASREYPQPYTRADLLAGKPIPF